MHHRDPRRRRTRHQRLQDVHRQRAARRLHRPRQQDQPRGAGTAASPSSSSTCPRTPAQRVPGFTVSKELKKMGMHASDTGELAFEDVRVPASGAILGEDDQGLPHRLGAAGRADGRRAGCGAGAERMMRGPSSTPRSARLGRPIGNSRRSATSSPRWRPRSRPGSSPTRPLALRRRRTRSARSPISELYTSRIACEVADKFIQILGVRLHEGSRDRARLPRVRLDRIGAGTDEMMLEVIGSSYGLSASLRALPGLGRSAASPPSNTTSTVPPPTTPTSPPLPTPPTPPPPPPPAHPLLERQADRAEVLAERGQQDAAADGACRRPPLSRASTTSGCASSTW